MNFLYQGKYDSINTKRAKGAKTAYRKNQKKCFNSGIRYASRIPKKLNAIILKIIASLLVIKEWIKKSALYFCSRCLSLKERVKIFN